MSAPSARQPKKPHSPITQLALPIYIPSLLWSTGSGALAPVMVLAALAFGFSQSQASLTAGLFGLVGVMTGPWLGRVINRTSDRTAFITGTVLAVGAASGTLVALAAPQMSSAKAVYIVGITCLSISANLWTLARQAYVADSLPIHWRARGMSMMGGMVRIGNLIGPAVGSAAILWWGLPGSFWVQIVTVVVAFIMVMVFVLPTPAALHGAAQFPGQASPIPVRPLRQRADVTSTVLLATGTVILTLVRTNRNVVVPLWGDQLGISDHVISATFAASALLDTAMFYPAGRIMDARGRRWALLPTLLIMGVGFLAMAWWTTPVGFVVCACLIGFGNGFGSGIMMTMGADLSPDVNRSSFLGVWQSISLVGSTAGPFLCAALVTALGVQSTPWVTGTLSLMGAAWFMVTVPIAYRRLGVDERGVALPPAGMHD